MNTTSTDHTVRIGSRVRVRDSEGEDDFTIVPDDEANAGASRLSAHSPLGRALLGRRAGERVLFRAPGGLMGVTVVAVD